MRTAGKRKLLWLLIAFAPACGGGGGGGGGPPGPPPPAFAQTTNTQLSIAAAFVNTAVLAQRVFAPVSEIETGADLNGDADQTDQVLHQVDTGDGAVLNLGLATIGPVFASDRHLAFLVGETEQNATDLNGDADTNDTVWHVYDPALPQGPMNPLNTGIAAPPTGLPGAGTTGGFVLVASEASSGADLNNDGDLLDNVPTVFNGTTFTVSALAVPPWAPASPLVARNGRVLVALSEAAAGAGGTDMNNDADQTDVILGAVTFGAGLPAFVPLMRAVATHPYTLTDGAAAYFIDEATEAATDLNNDTDALDAVLAVFDFAGGTLESLPFSPLVPAFALAGTTSLGIAAGTDLIVVGIDEAGQAGRDINLDLDSTDSIVAWVDTRTAPTFLNLLTGFTHAPRAPLIDGPRGLVAISETSMTFAGTDLNGDADVNDTVIFLLDTTLPAGGQMINLGFAVGTFALDGDDALIGVSEASDGGIDRNGDADANDIVEFYFDLGVRPITSRGLGLVALSMTFFRLNADEVRIAALAPEGQNSILDDLNGDGDSTDNAIELVLINPSIAPPALVDPTPFFAGTATALGAPPPLRVGDDVFVFATSEQQAGVDLNEDGDLGDTVLQYTTILPDE